MKKTVFYLIALVGFMYTTGCGFTQYRTSRNYQSGYGERMNYGQVQSGQVGNVYYGQRPVAQHRNAYITPSDSGKVRVGSTVPIFKPYIEPPRSYYHQHVYDRFAGYSYNCELIRQCKCGRNWPLIPAGFPSNCGFAPGR